ncbi:MAG: choice-of-anchor J domain-containing protein, partial [Bacteroidales bacterium]|nr:choice-of-anchor J domain-containing protein [Bacteroidales bacterium]
PITIDPTQSLWVVLYNTGVDYPASASTYAGNADGSWVSLDGNNWNSICDYGYNLSWMIRPVLSSGSTPQTYTVTAVSANTSMGTVTGGGTYDAGTTIQLTATAYQGYEFVTWQDGNTSNPRTITVTENATYTAYFQAVSTNCTVTSFPWTESFEDGWNCWTTIDADGDGNYWGRTSNLPAHDGSYTLYSYSYDSNNDLAIDAENYLISPQITLPATGNYQLTFYARCASSSYPDSLWVKMSTTGNTNVSAFNTVLMTKTAIAASYQQYTVSLSGHNGQSFYLAFVHDSYDGYVVLLDDISIVDASVSYTITATSANTTMGTVSGGGTYTAGAVVELEAHANPGYRFTGWNDGNTENPRSFTVMSNASYTASFADLGSGELHYDNGTFSSAVGAGGTIYWAVRFPASVLSSYNTLTNVKIWDQNAGTYQIAVYQGGTDAPGTQIATQTFSLSGTEDWYNAVFSSPISINNTQALWIVLYNSDVSHPAAGSNYAGNVDGSWVSLDGSTWGFVGDHGLYYSWMVRPVLSASTLQTYTITVVSSNNTMGTVSGGGTYTSGAEVTLEAMANPGYRFTGWNDNVTENPRSFTATSNASYTAYFADLGTNELHYDNGTIVNSMGAGGNIYWAVRFPASVLTSYNTLNSIRIWNQYAGSYEVRICQGGTDAPGTQLATQTYTLSGTGAWFDATLSTPVTINPAQPLWIVLYNTGVTYPAAGSTYAGNPDGSWVSLDGNNWNSICDYGYYLSWMIRPVLSAGSTPQTYTITALSSNNSMGTVTGGGSYTAGTTVQLIANPAANHHFVSWNDGNTSNPRYITVTGNATYIATFAVDQYQIDVLSGNDAMGTTSGSGTYDYGSAVQIRAIPYANYEFVNWSDGNTDNPRDITVLGNMTFVANFQPQTGINDNDLSAISVYSHDHQIMVCHAEGESIGIFDMLGKRIAYDAVNTQETRQFTISTKGVYLVRVGDTYFKKVVIK